MMRGFVLLLRLAFFFYCPITFAQSALIVSEDDSEPTNLAFNPVWIREKNIQEIVFDRFYQDQHKDKRYNSVSLLFDSTGYQTAELEAQDSDHPDQQTFLKKKEIQYLIYGQALIKSVKTFGRKNDTDTLENFPDANILAGNPQRLPELIIGPDTIFYKFDDLRRPIAITQPGGINIRTIEYNKSGLISKIMENYKMRSQLRPGSYREYEYNDDGQVTSVKLYSGSHMFMRVRYEYNEKSFPMKAFIYVSQRLDLILVYRYFFK